MAEHECDTRSISATGGIRSFINRRVAPDWLNRVAGGAAPDNVTAQVADEQAEEARRWNRKEPEAFFTQLREAWLAIGSAWKYLLQGMASVYEGDVVALFHRDGLGLGYELAEYFRDALPRAELCTSEFSWVVAPVPAILSLFLKERERGMKGLVLDGERVCLFDPRRCGLFLRNLLVDLGCGELARHVREVDPAHDPVPLGADDMVESPTGLHWQLQGFATGNGDAGLTRERCLTALRAAVDDQELRPLQSSARTRKK